MSSVKILLNITCLLMIYSPISNAQDSQDALPDADLLTFLALMSEETGEGFDLWLDTELPAEQAEADKQVDENNVETN